MSRAKRKETKGMNKGDEWGTDDGAAGEGRKGTAQERRHKMPNIYGKNAKWTRKELGHLEIWKRNNKNEGKDEGRGRDQKGNEGRIHAE